MAGSGLVNGFSHPLPSASLIQAAVDHQNSFIAAGNAVDTGLPANGLNAVDPGSYQAAAHSPLTVIQAGALIQSWKREKCRPGRPHLYHRGFLMRLPG